MRCFCSKRLHCVCSDDGQQQQHGYVNSQQPSHQQGHDHGGAATSEGDDDDYDGEVRQRPQGDELMADRRHVRFAPSDHIDQQLRLGSSQDEEANEEDKEEEDKELVEEKEEERTKEEAEGQVTMYLCILNGHC